MIAACNNALLGTQPTFKQSPPANFSDINADFAPRRPDCLDVTNPPAPEPIAIISYISYIYIKKSETAKKFRDKKYKSLDILLTFHTRFIHSI